MEIRGKNTRSASLSTSEAFLAKFFGERHIISVFKVKGQWHVAKILQNSSLTTSTKQYKLISHEVTVLLSSS